MIGRSNSFLGLAVADRGITCAEVSVTGGRRTVRRTATLALTPELSLENAAALGQALASFLRANRFTASRAVVGIPARWLMAVEKEIPPADETQARAALRLQAERLAVAESGELVFDYAGRIDHATASRVLLVGTLRQRLDNIEKTIDAAGISLLAVTSTGLALANCAEKLADDSSIVMLNRGGGAEMILRGGGEPRMLRHVSLIMNGHGTPPVAPLVAELKRAVALARTNGQPVASELLLLNGIGLPSDEINQIVERLGVRIRPENGADALGIARELSPTDSDPAEAIDQYVPAMALAVTGAEPQLLPMDFRHSRLAPPQPRRIDRRAALGIALGVLALAGIGLLYFVVHRQQSELDQLSAQLKDMEPRRTAAQATVDRVHFGRGYFDQRPAVLEGLRQVTLAFRDDERIWLTNFKLSDTGKGQIIGKAADNNLVLAIRDRLQKNSHFTDVKMVDMRDSDNRSREVAFSISFNFNYSP